MTDFIEFGYLGLFLASFLAATILPLGSEALFSLMIYNGFDVEACIVWASIGNWLGGMSGYWLGRWNKIRIIERWFRIKPESIEAQQRRLARWGSVIAFFCWLPAIGDILAVALGYFRCSHWAVSIWMLFGKAVRYIVWTYFTFIFI